MRAVNKANSGITGSYKMKFTENEIAHFNAFEKVRKVGKYNMLSHLARGASGLNKEAYRFVMSNYDALKAQAMGVNENETN